MPGVKGLRASFYRWRNPAGPSPRAVRHVDLVTAVTDLYEKEEGRAGRDQLTLLLNAAGTKVSAPTVGAIMRQNGLRAIRTQAWKRTTLQDPQAKTAHIENHMLDDQGKRDFTSAVPGTRLVGDITYLRTGEGWLNLATVIDLFSGMVIGWSMAEHARQPVHRGPANGTKRRPLLRTGRGLPLRPRYRIHLEEFQKWCGTNGVTQSMGKVGVCWDNAVAENFFYLKPSSTTTNASAPGSLPGPPSWTTSKAGTTAADPTAVPAAHHQPPPIPSTKPPFRNPWPPNQQQRELSQKLDERSATVPHSPSGDHGVRAIRDWDHGGVDARVRWDARVTGAWKVVRERTRSQLRVVRERPALPGNR